MIKLWPVLPKDDPANGLTVIEKLMTDDPEREHIAVVILNRKRLKIEDDSHESVPQARVLRIEVITRADHVQAVRDALEAAQAARTGDSTLPFGQGGDG